MTQGIYINVSRRNDDLPQLIEEYSEQFNLSKADTVAEILSAYPKLLAYKHRVMEQKIPLHISYLYGTLRERLKLFISLNLYYYSIFNLFRTAWNSLTPNKNGEVRE